MWQYLIRRLLMVIPVMFGVTVLVFLMLHLTPADPALIMLGERATEEELVSLRKHMGLDRPLPVQYLSFIGRAVQGDLGKSIRSNRAVSDELLDRLPFTIRLAVAAMVIATVIGILVGVLSATRSNTAIDNAATTGALLGVAMPNFWLGLLLQILFAAKLGWLKATGSEGPQAMILPAITLGTGSLAIILRMTRSSMLEVIRMDYIRTARSKGLGEKVVIYRHALRNALVPVITVIGIVFGGLLGGAVITETVFAWPGIGSFMIQAIRAKDFPVVQGAVLMLAVMAAMVNLAVDLIYAVIDPRIRAQYTR